MMQLTQGQTHERIIVTLNETRTLVQPYYLFIFIHVATKQPVAFIKSTDDDESEYAERYNQFEINTEAVFGASPPGQWHYVIYEQESATNLEPANATTILEYGKMLLLPATPFEYSAYNCSTTYKAYNG